MEIQEAENEQKSMDKRLKKKEALQKRRLKANMKEAKKLDEETNVDLDNTGMFHRLVTSQMDLPDDVSLNEFSLSESEDDPLDNSDEEESDSEEDFDQKMERKKVSLLEKQLSAQMEFLKNASLNKKKAKYGALSNELVNVCLFILLI